MTVSLYVMVHTFMDVLRQTEPHISQMVPRCVRQMITLSLRTFGVPWTRSNNKWHVGCFRGTGEELIKKAYQDSEKSGREYERVVRYVESILADEQKEQEK